MYIHIVKANETLWSIARQYNVTVRRIIIDNGLTNQPFLVVGQALLILITEVSHTVSIGETVFSISNMYEISQNELYQKNPNIITDGLKAGEVLSIRFQNEGNKPMAVTGYVYPYINLNLFQKELPYLSSCAVFSYGFNYDGNLIYPNDQRVLPYINRFNTAPIMLVSSITENGGFDNKKTNELLNNKNLQTTVIDNLISEALEKGYLGIDLDFEFIGAEDSNAYVEFVGNVKEKANNNGITVNVDLAPKTSTAQQGTLYEGHNYAKLGNIADTVFLMTYEWGYTYGPPMAVAPLPGVRRVVNYAVSQIENSKIIMGIPNYGYDWRLPYEMGTTKAKSIGNQEAIQIALQNGATIKFDEDAKSPYFEYISESGNNHIVWFEDIRSIVAKYQLIEEYNLKGGGYWNLMRPFAQNWTYIGYKYKIFK